MNIKKLIEKEIGLIIIISILIVIGAIFWFSSDNTEDFGLNFLTEMLGVLVTVLIVDKVIQIRDKNRLLPQKMVVYEDIRLFVTRYIMFWTEAFHQSVPEPDPNNLQDFFSNNGMPKILEYLHLNGEPNVTPPRKWSSWLVENAREFEESGDKILDRHAHMLEPEVYASIHQLTESSFNKTILMIPNIMNVDRLHSFPRVNVFGSYSIPTEEEDFKAILYLHDWCEKQFESYKIIKPSINRVIQYKPILDKKMPPKSQIPDEVLLRESKAFAKFQRKK